jgi:hypothetical protein
MWIFWVLSLTLQAWLITGIVQGTLGALGILGELFIGTLSLLLMIPAVKLPRPIGDVFMWLAILVFVTPELILIGVMVRLILN